MVDIFELSDAEFEEMVLQSPKPVLVAVAAPWAGPCIRMEPILQEVADAFAEKVDVLKLNTDENPATPRRLEVTSVPTLVLFVDGQEVDRVVGVTPVGELKQRLEQALEVGGPQ